MLNVCHFCQEEFSYSLITLSDGRECCHCKDLMYDNGEWRLATSADDPDNIDYGLEGIFMWNMFGGWWGI